MAGCCPAFVVIISAITVLTTWKALACARATLSSGEAVSLEDFPDFVVVVCLDTVAVIVATPASADCFDVRGGEHGTWMQRWSKAR